jgi:chemotaxis protein CheD
MNKSTIEKYKSKSLPAPLAGYEGINRHWNPKFQAPLARILPGEIYVTKEDEHISTLLGSCISVCMRDKLTGVGGMNHFMLPTKPTHNARSDENYGMYAIELLINGIIKNGGKRHNLECRIFGGGDVISNISHRVGANNLAFTLNFLRNEKIPILSKNTGAKTAQMVYYHPLSGNAYAIQPGKEEASQVKKLEKTYLNKINKDMERDDITYFD